MVGDIGGKCQRWGPHGQREFEGADGLIDDQLTRMPVEANPPCHACDTYAGGLDACDVHTLCSWASHVRARKRKEKEKTRSIRLRRNAMIAEALCWARLGASPDHPSRTEAQGSSSCRDLLDSLFSVFVCQSNDFARSI